MVFGYSTNAFVKYSLLDSFDRIARLGFAGVEIMCDQPHLYPPEYDNEKLTAVKASLEKNGLKPTNLNSFTLFAVGDTYLPSWIEPEADRRRIRVDHTLACLGDCRVHRVPQHLGATGRTAAGKHDPQ
jgi:sugar phosphate isomerase/epimerase